MFVQLLPAGLLRSFLVDGLIAGVGSVLVFLPQILTLFFFIILLEDLGYMARAAFLMDKMMGAAGLHGRAFIPLLSSFACAIPGIMATRVIDNKRDRFTTILAAPLTTCSARIPVYTLIIAAFIPDPTGLGLRQPAGSGDVRALRRRHLSSLTVALVMRRIFWRGASEPFLIELPSYKVPDPKNILRGLLLARADLPAPRRHHHPPGDDRGLVPVELSGRARRCRRARPSITAWPACSAIWWRQCSRPSASAGR